LIFAATLLPPKMCLNTGITEDWWQGGSKNLKKIFTVHKSSTNLISNLFGAFIPISYLCDN